MDKNFTYPIVEDWTRDEMISVIDFFRAIENAYEDQKGVSKKKLADQYAKFRKINPSKVEQRKLERDFENVSGYPVYPVLKKLEDESLKIIKMK